jgi:predicted RNA-binding protein YlxR (DUF448 family)
VTAAAAIRDGEDDVLRERRCIVTGEVLAEGHLIRFVADPDGRVVPDIAAKLPGRGMWVSAERAILERAIARNHFSKAAKAPLSASPDLPDRVEKLIVQRMADDLGLARRAGSVVLGFDQITKAFEAKPAPVLLVEASDGSADGKRKLFGAAFAQGLKPRIIDCLNCEELSLALGRENVVHAALKSGQLAERLELNAGRLAGFRVGKIDVAGRNPAADERHE